MQLDSGHGCQEVVALERVERDISDRTDCRGPRNVPQQAPLAELIASSQFADEKALDLDD